MVALLWPVRMTSISNAIKGQCGEIGQLAGPRDRTLPQKQEGRKKTDSSAAAGSAFLTSLFSIQIVIQTDLILGKTKLSYTF